VVLWRLILGIPNEPVGNRAGTKASNAYVELPSLRM
jgi:hypothetical protein